MEAVVTRTTQSTPQEVRAKIDAMLYSSADKLDYLWGRWQDEQEHEDFAQYAAAMKAYLPEGFTFIKATKRPFGMHFSADVVPGSVYLLFSGANGVGWKRVKAGNATLAKVAA